MGRSRARTVLEVNWCWGCRRLGGGEAKGTGAGCPTEPPSVWLSCPGARLPKSSLAPHTVVSSTERGGSGGDPICGGPHRQGTLGGFPHPGEPLQPPSTSTGPQVPPWWEQASPSRSPPSPTMAAPPGWSHTPRASHHLPMPPCPQPARVETRCPWRERRGGTSVAGGRLLVGSGTSAGGGAGGTLTC